MKIKLSILFISIVAVVAMLLEYEKTLKIEKYISNKTKEHQAMYDAIYHSFKKRADIAYTLIQNDNEIISIYKKLQNSNAQQKNNLRKKLQDVVNKKYAVLNNQGVGILHFHLKNNKSFFRMHKNEKYDDDLSDFRQTVVFTNKNKKPADAFEVGKHFSGYRFIYPLSDTFNNKHLGSMEISFDLELYIKEFMDTLDVLSNFRIKKSIIDKKVDPDNIAKLYKQSKKMENYYVPKKVFNQLSKTKKEKIKKLTTSNKTIQQGLKSIENGKTISVYDTLSQNLITFIPVKNSITNEVCGFITIRSNDKYIYNKHLNSYFILAIFAISTLSGLIFIYREIKAQKELNINLQKKVDEKTKELKDINTNLKSMVKKEVDKNLKHEMELFKQSKLAAVGDMIGNIAHQWRQPLSVMMTIASGIKVKYECGILENDDLFKSMDSIVLKTQYLSETVETFRNYLKEKKEKVDVILQDRIDMAIQITKTALIDNNITIKDNINEIEPINISIVPGELTEVLINIINNAKDVLLEKKVKNPFVNVILEKQKDFALICIEDNAGGIPDDIILKIFDQYFTTKDDNKGTGLGLHMAKKIIHDSLNGELYVKNNQNGAVFYIQIPLDQ